MMVHLGNISFELYIVHQVLITLFASPARKLARGYGSIAMVLLLGIAGGWGAISSETCSEDFGNEIE